MSGGARSSAGIQATVTATDQQQQAVQVTVSGVPVLAAMPQQKERPDFEVLVRVRAPTDATRRAPVDLVAVLDVSGSMNCSPEKANSPPAAGERSRLDLLKDAMKFIVGHLPYGDRLAIVTFNKDVVPLPKGSSGSDLTEISDATRKSLNATVDGLVAKGGTSFAPGLDKAFKILKDRSNTDRERRVGFIVFLSDGEESKKGDWRKKELEDMLKEKEHTVHTFGFSKFHDPAALHDIAGLSGGTYSFLNTGLDKITDAFAFCLGGLKTVVATGVIIDLAVPDPKVEITSIDSGGYRAEVEEKKRNSGRITIPVLYAGEVKDFIVHLNVPSHDKSKQDLLRVDGKCRLDGAHSVELEDAQVKITRPPLADDSNQQPAKQDGEVIKQVLRFKVLQMLKDFLEKTKSWDLKNNKEQKDEAVKKLGDMWDKLKNENESILNDLDKQQGVVERYDGYVNKMRADLKDGDGGAHVMSFDSSNNVQQVTTMGSPENVVPEFKTEEIKKMGGEAKKQRGEPVPEPDVPPPAVARTPEEMPPWPCGCIQYDIIGRQLAYWSVVKRDLLLLVEQVEGDGGHRRITGTFHDRSLASINRAMYESVFLAVEHAHNIKSCYCAATGHHAVVAAGYNEEEL